ncbi:rhodanese-like domain-containing protein [Gilvimarinus sp. F26214L]|uniref:rhodanese-like domain-containing protein n=1 Tax=Gilvimarinus sp. DZF01 TaxID=3461371 RepID=UPI00404575E3
MDFFIFISEQFWLIAAFLVLLYIFFWNEKRRGGRTLTSHELTRLMNNDEAVLVDIRESADFNAGHIVNAIHLPFNKVNDRWEELLPHKDKLIVLADKMGQHAGTVGNTLRKKEFKVGRLQGGMTEWQNQNLPLVK